MIADTANSLIALAFASEHPAFRSCEAEIKEIFLAERLPPANSSTRVMMVRAAFVESCWESMEDASEAKLLSRDLSNFPVTPMVQNPARSITASKRGFIAAISRAIARERANEMTMWEKVAVNGSSLFHSCSLFLASYSELQ